MKTTLDIWEMRIGSAFKVGNTWVGWQSTMELDYKWLYIAIPRNLELTGSGKAAGFLPHNNLCVERKL